MLKGSKDYPYYPDLEKKLSYYRSLVIGEVWVTDVRGIQSNSNGCMRYNTDSLAFVVLKEAIKLL